MFKNCTELKYIQFIPTMDWNGEEEENIKITEDSIKGASLPSSVTYIGRNAFQGAINLLVLEIPHSVIQVGATILQGWLSSQVVNVYYNKEADLPGGWNSLWKNNCNAKI